MSFRRGRLSRPRASAGDTGPVTRKPRETKRPRRPPETSQPEIRVGYTVAGRETLDAITDELLPLPLPARPLPKKPPPRDASSPEITVREGVIERDTLAAIMEEAGATGDVESTPTVKLTVPRAKMTTKSYEDDDATTRVKVPAPRAKMTTKSYEDDDASAVAAELEIFEMATFVVRGGDVARLASERLRREFVEKHLLGRLPVGSMAEVDRVDVTPWTAPGTLVVRVWCRISPRKAPQDSA